MPRNARKWNEYPEEYFRILDHFRTSQSEHFISRTMSQREAIFTRHDLHRFFRKLDQVYKDEPYVRDFADIARLLVIAIRQAPNDRAVLIFTRRPTIMPEPPEPLTIVSLREEPTNGT